MRRWLCLLLLICLPLQLSWAVAATYCQHEQGPGAGHYGHHEHEHHEHQVPDQQNQHPQHDGAATPDATVDHDCAACHLGALQPLPLAMTACLADTTDALVPHPQRGHASHIPPAPERPDRAFAA